MAGATAAPWQKAEAVVRATDADIAKGGIQAIRSHVPELETALASGRQAFEPNSGVVLTDGPAETLAALVGASASGRQVAALRNPYPAVGFFLGTYYNETGRPDEALRALDAGLKLSPLPGADLGDSVPLLLAEPGAALSALKRYSDSLANFDRALQIKNLKSDARAVMQRGRGFALIELGRLDEAEQAYRDSLATEPNNPRAQQELSYIARLRAGGPMAPAGLITRQPMMMR